MSFRKSGRTGAIELTFDGCRARDNQLRRGAWSYSCYGAQKSCLRPWLANIANIANIAHLVWKEMTFNF